MKSIMDIKDIEMKTPLGIVTLREMKKRAKKRSNKIKKERSNFTLSQLLALLNPKVKKANIKVIDLLNQLEEIIGQLDEPLYLVEIMDSKEFKIVRASSLKLKEK